MDYETIRWIRAIHFFAFITWAGALISLSFILKQHTRCAQEARKDFIALEKPIALAMDIGATFAIAAGVFMLIEIPDIMKGHGWMHAKLTLIVVLIGLHGFQRARVGKYKRGEVGASPTWVIPAIQATVLAIVVLAAAKPF